MQPKTLLQYFEWYLPADAGHWKRAAAHAAHLRQAGFTGVWLPPAYKGAAGRNDVGYGVYDLYDLGEFDQKGSVPTKYGTKEEYLAAVRALQGQGLAVLADVVLNHRMGADACEQVDAEACDPGDRRRETGPRGAHFRLDEIHLPRPRGQVFGLSVEPHALRRGGLGRPRPKKGRVSV